MGDPCFPKFFYSIEIAGSEKEGELCSGWILEGKIEPGLSDAERRLVCGDPKNPSWKALPLNQAKFHLRNFLQARGFFYHNIQSVSYDPATGQLAVKVRFAEGTSLNLGANPNDFEKIGIRKRLVPCWAITTDLNNPTDSGERTVSAFLEWSYRY